MKIYVMQIYHTWESNYFYDLYL